MELAPPANRNYCATVVALDEMKSGEYIFIGIHKCDLDV
jgi:hypothetical protein